MTFQGALGMQAVDNQLGLCTERWASELVATTRIRVVTRQFPVYNQSQHINYSFADKYQSTNDRDMDA